MKTTAKNHNGKLAKKTEWQERIDVLNKLAEKDVYSDLDHAEKLVGEAHQLAISGPFLRCPYRKGVADSLRLLAQINSNRDNAPHSLALNMEALPHYEAIDELSGQAKVLANIGFEYAILGNHSEALATCLKGMEIAHQSGDPGLESYVLNSIGVTYAVAKEYDKAFKHFLSCLEIDTRLGLDTITTVLNNCSICCYEMGDYQKSLEYGQRCLDVAQQKNEQHMILVARDQIAEVYIKLGEYDLASTFLQANLAILPGSETDNSRYLTWRCLGKLKLWQNRPHEALEYLQKSFSMTEAGKVLNSSYDTLEFVVEAYKQLGDFEQALATAQERQLLREKIFEQQIDDKAKGIEAIYRIKDAQKESEILRMKNAELEQEVLERQRAEAEAQRQSRYFKTLLENTPFGIVMLGTDFLVEDCNLAFERLFGLSRAEIIDRHIRQIFVHPIVEEDFKNHFPKVTNGETVHIKTKRPSVDGTLIDVELTAAPIMLDGERQGILLSHHDIRERIQTEATLHEAKIAAEAATQAKSAFLANMSHEIRTPLNGVVGMTSLLQETRLTNEQNEFVQVIRSSSDALLEIINEILDFSKIEAGKLELEERPFELRMTVEAALDVVAPKAADKGLELGYWVDDAIPMQLIGDVTRFRQILVNLLSNAVKFTETGEVFVLMEMVAGENGRFQLQGSVRDTGIGIPKERMGKLFHSFNQLDESTTRKFGGTGLGLAISKRLAELMGGTMWAESQLGQGSTFLFTIESQPVAEEFLPSNELGIPLLAGKRLLIIDDQDFNRQILSRYINTWGMRSVASLSITGAFSMLAQDNGFDALLLNSALSPDNYPQVVADLRATARKPEIPVILLTPFGKVNNAQLPHVLPLAKPIKPSRLYNALLQIFMEETAVPKPQKTKSNPLTSKQDSPPLRLLLAEDNLINQKVALRMLDKLGYKADVATNGRKALQALEENPYDVVFMDVQMPEMDGVTATHHIHERFAAGERPYIIAMTANALVGDRENYLKNGMDDYLSKPVRLSDLEAALSRFLKR